MTKEKTRTILQANILTGMDSLTAICHEDNLAKGWWKGIIGKSREIIGFAIGSKLALAHSELSEALEGYRKDLMDDKLPNRKMVEVELADAIIRIADLAGFLNLDLGGAIIEKLEYNKVRADHKMEIRAKRGGKEF